MRSPSSVFCSVSEHLPPTGQSPHQLPASSRPAGSHFQHPTPASLAKRQPFPAELATLPHRPWAPKPSEPSISGFSSTKSGFLCSEDWESGIGNPKIGIGNTESGRSCKSPRTPLKCKVLITRQLTFEGVLDELKLCSPSTAIKYKYLCIRCLCFEGVLGDLHERRPHQVAALSGTQHLRPFQATASSGGDMEVA